MIKLNGEYVKPTIFPDGTSQMWGFKEPNFNNNIIEWEFESEAEVMQVIQLAYYVACKGFTLPELVVPFLPYARQDKALNSRTTFALHPFLNLLDKYFLKITALDIHNAVNANMDRKLINIEPHKQIMRAVMISKPHIIVFPDKGAKDRYANMKFLEVFDYLIMDKVRDQKTGEIKGLTVVESSDLIDTTMATALIIDDICDGGRTFIEATKELKERGVHKVDLYTTHGIYSKGIQVLKDAGIRKIFNRKGEVK